MTDRVDEWLASSDAQAFHTQALAIRTCRGRDCDTGNVWLPRLKGVTCPWDWDQCHECGLMARAGMRLVTVDDDDGPFETTTCECCSRAMA